MKNKTRSESQQHIIPFTRARSLIDHLQEMVARRFGREVQTESGAATLSVAWDRITLTDGGNRIIAESAVGCISALGRSGTPAVLSNEAVEMVEWFAEKEHRDPADVINGVLVGNLEHAKNHGNCDDSLEHTREYVMGAIERRAGAKIAA